MTAATAAEILSGLCGLVIGFFIGALVVINAEKELNKKELEEIEAIEAERARRNCGG